MQNAPYFHYKLCCFSTYKHCVLTQSFFVAEISDASVDLSCRLVNFYHTRNFFLPLSVCIKCLHFFCTAKRWKIEKQEGISLIITYSHAV